MFALTLLILVVLLAFAALFATHYLKTREQRRAASLRKIQDYEVQIRAVEPLITRLRPHLLPHSMRIVLAERWYALLELRQQAGDHSPEMTQKLAQAEAQLRDIKAEANPKVHPVESDAVATDMLHLLRSVHALITREFKEGRLAEAKGKKMLAMLRHSATQVIVEQNQSRAEAFKAQKQYRKAMACYQNIIKELNKYRGTDQEVFRETLQQTRHDLEKAKQLADEYQPASIQRDDAQDDA